MKMNTLSKKIILIVGLFLCVVLPSYGMTISEILDRVRVNIKDQSSVTSRQQFSDATLINFANDGQREANILAWLLQDKVTITLVSGTTEYNLPSDFLSTDRVIHNNVKLAQTSLNQLDADMTGWLSSTGASPQKYYLYKTTTTVIGFVPAPKSPTVTAVYVYYIKQPNEITSTSNTPWNGWGNLTPYHSALVYYISYRAYRVLEEDTLSAAYYQEWAAMIELMRHGIYTMPDFNPGFQGQRK